MNDTLRKMQVPFTQVANSVLNDKELSAKAKGLFAYLYSKPQGWDFSVHRIQEDFSDGTKSIGKALRELEEHGYLERKREASGRMQYFLSFGGSKQPYIPFGYKPNVLQAETDTVSNKDNTKKEREEKKELAGDRTPAKGSSRHNPLGTAIIKAFEAIDSQNKTYYGNRTQRSACDFLIEEYGLEQVLKVINELLPKTNKRPRYEFPHISTPYLLKINWSKLADSAVVKNNENKSEVAFI